MNSYQIEYAKPAPAVPSTVLPAQPNLPHPALGNMNDTKQLAKLMRQCCQGIEDILREPLNDKQAEASLRKLEDDILTHWPLMGYTKMLGHRHAIYNLRVS